jgi:hypothetical protein
MVSKPHSLLIFLALGTAHSGIGDKIGLLLDATPTTSMSIAMVKPVSHVGLGYITGFVISADPSVTYPGPNRLPIQTARANPSYAFAINGELKYQRYMTFPYTQSVNPNASLHLVLSDGWGKRCYWPYSTQASSADRAEWEGWVKRSIDEARSRLGSTQNIVIDIFNEPEALWGETECGVTEKMRYAFLDTRPVSSLEYYTNWKNTVKYIRSLGSDYASVKIAGPTTSGYNYFIHLFLQQAYADNVLPDIVNWHELSSGSRFNLDQNVGLVRKYMFDNDIPARPIGINEYCGKNTRNFQVGTDNVDTHAPATAIAFISKLEKADVATAAKSCWPFGSDDLQECENGSYSGLYSSQNGVLSPRSIWWAYKWYSDASGAYLPPPYLEPTEAFFGSYDDSARRLQLIFSNSTTEGEFIGSRGLVLNQIPSGLFGQCRITLERIIPSGFSSYTAPDVVWSSVMNVSSSLVLTKPRIDPENVYRFVITKI